MKTFPHTSGHLLLLLSRRSGFKHDTFILCFGNALLVLILLNYCQDKGEHLRFIFFFIFAYCLFNPLLNRRGATILFYLLTGKSLWKRSFMDCPWPAPCWYMITFSSYQRSKSPQISFLSSLLQHPAYPAGPCLCVFYLLVRRYPIRSLPSKAQKISRE